MRESNITNIVFLQDEYSNGRVECSIYYVLKKTNNIIFIFYNVDYLHVWTLMTIKVIIILITEIAMTQQICAVAYGK